MMETLALLIHPPQVQLDRYLSGRRRTATAKAAPMLWDVTPSIRLTKTVTDRSPGLRKSDPCSAAAMELLWTKNMFKNIF
jgi:hypothetical protein